MFGVVRFYRMYPEAKLPMKAHSGDVGFDLSGYTGEIKCILFNAGEDMFVASEGDRIGQLVVMPPQAPITALEDFDPEKWVTDDDRGEKGFGSTGT